MPTPRPCPASARSAWRCISAARSCRSAPYRAAYARIAELVRTLRAGGLTVETVDCGGGLGIPYRDEPAPSPTALAGAIAGALHNLDLRLTVEPGRWLVGPAGVLLASVILVKQADLDRRGPAASSCWTPR